jgi:hypothetical protein
MCGDSPLGWTTAARFPEGARIFSLRHRVHTGSGSHPASNPAGTEFLSSRIKRPDREAETSPPSNAQVKNAWRCTSTPPYVFMACCLVKYKDTFTFTLPVFILQPVPVQQIRIISMELCIHVGLRHIYIFLNDKVVPML